MVASVRMAMNLVSWFLMLVAGLTLLLDVDLGTRSRAITMACVFVAMTVGANIKYTEAPK